MGQGLTGRQIEIHALRAFQSGMMAGDGPAAGANLHHAGIAVEFKAVAVAAELPGEWRVDQRAVGAVHHRAQGQFGQRRCCGREHHMQIARAFRAECAFGLDRLVPGIGGDRHHIITKGQIERQRVAGGLAHEAELIVRDLPKHLARDQRGGRRLIRPEEHRLWPHPLGALMGGEGEGASSRRGDLFQRRSQLCGIVGGEEAAAGLFGDALHLHQRLGLALDVKADDMGGEINACFIQRAGGGAGVGVAGLDPVRDQDHGRRLFGMAQRLRGGDHGISHRRHAARVQPVDNPGNLRPGAGGRVYHRLDVGTLPALAVAIGDKAKVLIRREGADKIAHHITRDGDLVHPVDLPPH